MSDLDWADWLASLDPPRRQRAVRLRDQFDRLGADDPEGWARSEVSEDLPHLARFVLLRSLWNGAIDGVTQPEALDRLPAAQRLLAAGVDRDDLARLARAVAYEAVFVTLDQLDAGGEASPVDVGWAVVERGGDSPVAGRVMDGLHEDLLSCDPRGRDGADFWD